MRLVLFIMLCLAGAAAAADAAEAKTVLMLSTYGYDAPGRLPFDAAFVRTLRDSPDFKIDVYIEAIDPNRFTGEAQAQRLRAYLRERYAGKKIDVLAASYDRALSFLLDATDPLFPDVPIAAVLTRFPESLPDRVAAVWDGNPFGESAALAVRLQPQTKHIAVIDGTPPSPINTDMYTEAIRQIEGHTRGMDIIPLRNLRLDELMARVPSLPPDSIILMARQSLGAHGEAVTVPDVIKALAPIANAPIYVSSDQQIGFGAVGGTVTSVESDGRRLAALSLRLFREVPGTIEPAEGTPVTIVDWRALQRWGISESRLPAGADVRYRDTTVWDQYRWYIVAAIVIVWVETGLIATLLAQLARRRRVEEDLRTSYEKNRGLAGRLIHAQEEERSRIARELHDDVGQQLAGLAIITSGLKRKVAKPAEPGEIEETFAMLQERAATVAQSVRSLSHDLHPTVLQHLGLVAALKRQCSDVGQLHHLKVTLSAGDAVAALRPDVNLCLYRVVQEVLTNAVRHAQAKSIALDLSVTGYDVELSIKDDGVGFVTGTRVGEGLGLRSIDERVRLLGGSVQLQSTPGTGTRVFVRVPLR